MALKNFMKLMVILKEKNTETVGWKDVFFLKEACVLKATVCIP